MFKKVKTMFFACVLMSFFCNVIAMEKKREVQKIEIKKYSSFSQKGIEDVIFDYDVKKIIVVLRNTTVRILDIATGKLYMEFKGLGKLECRVENVAISKDGKRIVISYRGESITGELVKLFDTSSGKQIAEFNLGKVYGDSQIILLHDRIVFSRRMYHTLQLTEKYGTGLMKGMLLIYEIDGINSKKPTVLCLKRMDWVHLIGETKDEKKIIFKTQDCGYYSFDLNNKKDEAEFLLPWQSSRNTTVFSSKDENFFFEIECPSYFESTIHVYKLKKNKFRLHFHIEFEGLEELRAISNDARFLASIHDRKTVTIWQLPESVSIEKIRKLPSDTYKKITNCEEVRQKHTGLLDLDGWLLDLM